MMMWLFIYVISCTAGILSGAPAITDPPANGTGTVPVAEDTATGTVIFTIQPPPQPTWTYAITAPATSPFNINNGGTVTVSTALDYDAGSTSYNLTLQVTDTADGSTTDRSLIVQVSNVFDIAPTITGPAPGLAVDEEMRIGATVVKFAATDLELSTGDVIQFSLQGPHAKYFQIDTATGDLAIRSRIDYDTGITPLSITVQVTDKGGNTASQAVSVTVNDINDNTPVCSPGVVYATAKENTPSGETHRLSSSGKIWKDRSFQNFQLEILERTIFPNLSFDLGFCLMTCSLETACQIATVQGVNVAAISCTDADASSNSDLTYSVFSGDDVPPKFALSGTTLSTTANKLDYETKSAYSIVIYAIDSPTTTPKKTGTVTVDVQVTPENDNTPVWVTLAGTSVNLPESSPLGTSVVTVVATDDDVGGDGTLTYRIVSTTANTVGAVTGVFSIDASTGKLSTLATIDRETVQSYDIVIKAADGGTPPQSTPDIKLTIVVADVNDNAPIFTAASVLTGSVTEGSSVGTSILTLVASDADASSSLTFLVTAGDVIPPKFRFNAGQLELASVIDLDQSKNDPDGYSLALIVTDGGTPELTGTTHVTVTVTPVNNHAPAFNTPSPAATVQVYDDRSAKIALETGPHGTRFQCNRHAPTVFPESTKPGTSVITVDASDKDFGKDGSVTYSITGGNTGSAFVIDSLSGEILTQTSLDFETTPQYDLVVTATDGGTTAFTTTTTVTVIVTDINEDAPTCPSYDIIVSIPEDTVTPTAVTSLNCADANPGDTLSYSITSGSPPGMFLINGGTGEIALTQALNYESNVAYILVVDVTDNGTPPLSVTVTVNVKVTPVNEFPPKFNPPVYTVAVNEGSATGTNVAQVTATDADVGALDGSVRYSITSGDPQGKFTMDRTTGQITLANPLDRETTDTYKLIVTAADDVPGSADEHVVTTSVYITVTDANDNPPVFNPSKYVASVSEDAKPLSVILSVTSSDDDLAGSVNTRATYRVVSGDTSNIFKFSNSDLRIAPTKSLHYATKSVYDLVIEAADQGTPPLTSTATVVISVLPANQNPPVFTNPKQSVSIPESLPVGSKVITATANDADSGVFGKVTYSIVRGNVPADTFVVDNSTGDILVWSALDRDSPPSDYNLTLQATDGGGTSVTTWFYINLLDVNDNQPAFAKNIYNIPLNEDVPVATTVIRTAATDADSGTNGEVSYSITSGDGMTSFAIDPLTGDITTRNLLDYEQKNKYSLVVMASDKGTPTANTATSLVVITLNDANDNAPVFTPVSFSVNLKENVAIGTTVVTMVATDADSKANSNNIFVYRLISSAFAIDPNKGEITTKADIDRERNDRHILTVTARDQNGVGVNVGTGTVTINILDDNDNKPVITGIYTDTLPENTAVGSILYIIKATDADSGNNALLSYSITNGDPNSDFRIDTASGILQLNKPLNRETTPSYTFTVTVSDNGISPLTDSVIVSFTITDTNDNNPIFQNLPYIFSIAENVPLSSTVGYVKALDADIAMNGDVEYEFVIFWQGPRSHFNINTVSGEITTAGGLDRETLDTYTVWLRTADKGIPRRYANTNITIRVADLNDHDPVFDVQSYSTVIREDVPILSNILTMPVTDKDTGVNAALSLSIDTTTTEGTRANLFFLPTWPPGRLSIKAPVDRETDQLFVFRVLAVDGGATPRTATTTVTINVLDVNDNRPVMSSLFYNAEVAYSGICDNTITTVSATDADVSSNGEINYYLPNTTYSFLFSINQNSGTVFLQNKATTNSRYVIQASAKDAGSPVLTASTPAIIRIDTFDPNVVAVTFKLNIDQASFQAQEATFISGLQALIQVVYPTAMFRVWCVEPRGDNSVSYSGRRKLLQNGSPVNVHAYTVTDGTTNSVGNINQTKSFLTSSQTLQFFSTDPLGTPISTLTGGELSYFNIEAVTRYYDPVTPWTQTLEGILVLTFIAIVVAVLIAVVIIVAVFTCRKKKRPIKPVRAKSIQSITVTTPIGTYNNPDVLYMERPAHSELYASIPTPKQPARPRLVDKLGDRKLQPFGITNREFDGRAVDPVTGLVYAYNTKTNQRQWLTTEGGKAVKVTHE